MAASTLIKSNVAGRITLIDGTGTPVTHSVSFDDGKVTLGPLHNPMNETVVFESRGSFKGAFPGKRIFAELGLNLMLAQFMKGSGTDETAQDFVHFTGKYAANVSTLGASHPIKTINVKVEFEGTTWGDGVDTGFIAKDCDFSGDFAEGDGAPSMLNLKARVLGDITDLSNNVLFAEVG